MSERSPAGDAGDVAALHSHLYIYIYIEDSTVTLDLGGDAEMRKTTCFLYGDPQHRQCFSRGDDFPPTNRRHHILYEVVHTPQITSACFSASISLS